jgi:hypothetical protein
MTAAPHPHPLRGPREAAMLPAAALTPSRAGALLAFSLGVLAFMPYPAIPAGRNSAVQLGNVLTLLMVLPTLALTWRRRPFQYFPVLLAPLVLSTLKVGVFGGDVVLSVKSLPVWAVSGLTIVATQLYAPRYARQLMAGIAAATLVHSAVGLWQLYTFTHGELPLVELYVNPSFLGVQERAHVIATYIQRPFGLFPEPSAMSSSLAPWVLLWLAEMAGLVRFPGTPHPMHRVLFVSAAAGGMLLIVLSRSGHAMVTVAGAMLLFVMWLRNAPGTFRTYATLLLVLGVLLPGLLALTVNALHERVGPSAVGNDSWDDRASSLVFGANLLMNGDLASITLGLGVGQSADMLWDLAGLDAVWSVLLTYLYETGLVGAVTVGWVAWNLFGVWRGTRLKVLFALFAGVWLVGVTVTTSYQQLLPLWVAFGWLTVWPEVCHAREMPAVAAIWQRRYPATPTGARRALA